LQTETVFSTEAPGQTSPKVVEPVTAIACCVPFPLACTVTDGFTGSSLLIVSVAVFGPGEVGVNRTSNGKQESGLITTGKPDDGAVTTNCGLFEVIEATSRSSAPVLQMLSVVVLVLPTQVSGKVGLLGTWIYGTQQTIRDEKKMSISVDGGVMPGGDMAEAQTL
jgi:hypothetical protein